MDAIELLESQHRNWRRCSGSARRRTERPAAALREDSPTLSPSTPPSRKKTLPGPTRARAARISCRSGRGPLAMKRIIADLLEMDPARRPVLDAKIRCFRIWSSVTSGGGGKSLSQSPQALSEDRAFD